MWLRLPRAWHVDGRRLVIGPCGVVRPASVCATDWGVAAPPDIVFFSPSPTCVRAVGVFGLLPCASHGVSTKLLSVLRCLSLRGGHAQASFSDFHLRLSFGVFPATRSLGDRSAVNDTNLRAIPTCVVTVETVISLHPPSRAEKHLFCDQLAPLRTSEARPPPPRHPTHAAVPTTVAPPIRPK